MNVAETRWFTVVGGRGACAVYAPQGLHARHACKFERVAWHGLQGHENHVHLFQMHKELEVGTQAGDVIF
jgi:hypothetical protein